VSKQTDEFKLQPNSAHCFVCGMHSPVGLKARFWDNGVDEVRATYVVEEKYQGYPGITHGGIVASLLDETAGRVVMIENPDRFFMTAKFEIRYRRPVPTQTELTLVGRMVKDRGRLIQAHGEIQLPDGTVAAEAEATLVEIPDEYVPDANLESLGWRVYPFDNTDET
jgi:uncharacterized protein (TIGR00369 family)